MDWLFATHERYMDFTHEVGFTKESLGQVCRSVFSKVDLFTADNNQLSFLSKVITKIIRKFFEKLIHWASPENSNYPIWDRSLICFCWG